MDGSEFEGRTGRTRRAYPGVPVGTFAEVEAAAAGAGWYLQLSQSDPRDGPPPSSWNVWAETEEDLRSWLGSAVLDVAWITERLPDETLAGLVSHADDGWRFRHVTPEGVAAWLHDAGVMLSEVELAGTAAVVPGLLEDLWQDPERRGRRLRGSRGVHARFPFVLVVGGATGVRTDDPAHIDQVIVGDVAHDREDRSLVIRSAVPGAIRITTPARVYRLAVARRPALVRRRWRWVPPDGGASAHVRVIDTAHGSAVCVRYGGPPRVNPAPDLRELRRCGIPEPHETLEIDVACLPTRARWEVVARVLAELGPAVQDAELHGTRRRGRQQHAEAVGVLADLVGAVDAVAWWAGEVWLVVRTRRGPLVVCSAVDGHAIVVVTGGYRRAALRAWVEAAAVGALGDLSGEP